MTSSPIPRVLGTFQKRRVKALLMGGQACILYGGAEFSRDIGFAIAIDERSLHRLNAALANLRAEPIDVPLLAREPLLAGHACHFRCMAPGLNKLRIDVMHRLRGAPPFETMWRRRRRVAVPGVGTVNVMTVEDLAAVKKTQRDKHWPMIRKLIEADVTRARRHTATKVQFWLLACRTPEVLVSLTQQHLATARKVARQRPLLRHAVAGDLLRVAKELRAEEDRERELDREYWRPLRAELERLRHERRDLAT